jgi:signal peptidase II
MSLDTAPAPSHPTLGVRKRWAMPLAVILSVVLLDQITKSLVVHHLRLYADHPVIEGCLSLQHVQNHGAAFGFFSRPRWAQQGWILFTVSSLAFVAIAVYAWRLPASKRLARVALALILGGAVGNIIDRARLGYVVDFVRMYFRQHDWPNYNVADSAITVGVSLLLIDMFLESRAAAVAARPAERME